MNHKQIVRLRAQVKRYDAAYENLRLFSMYKTLYNVSRGLNKISDAADKVFHKLYILGGA